MKGRRVCTFLAQTPQQEIQTNPPPVEIQKTLSRRVMPRLLALNCERLRVEGVHTPGSIADIQVEDPYMSWWV